MSVKNRTKAASKNIEGKIEETVGDLTGNHEAQIKGKVKQAEARLDNAIEDVKDEAKRAID